MSEAVVAQVGYCPDCGAPNILTHNVIMCPYSRERRGPESSECSCTNEEEHEKLDCVIYAD